MQEGADHRRDPMEDYQKLEGVYQSAKKLREYSEKFYKENSVVEMRKVSQKLTSMIEQILDYNYLVDMND